MIQWVYEATRRAAGVDRVIVATDDSRIEAAVRAFGGECEMTSPDLATGTDRVAAVADRHPAQIYVNVQGDEPLIDPEAIGKAVDLVRSGRYEMSTLMVPLRDESELRTPDVVKVVTDIHGRGLYFSRHPIPYSRGETPKTGFASHRHVGLYVYTAAALQKFRRLRPSPLERGELLEQLRALEHGMVIGVAAADFECIGVDTPADLERVRKRIHG
jgi:3-deoxy-manno-octulosonate cytidylyltransferase (CMP-KDO synthetase)